MDEAIPTLLGAFEFDHGRMLKRIDFDAMNRLHAKAFITLVGSKQRSA